MDNFNLSLEDLKKYLHRYEDFVRLNPRLASDVEAILRWSSYLIASRKSPIIGELLSSGANVLQLCNDILLRQANPELKLNLQSTAIQLRTCLSVIQSLELLAEIYARESYGKAGKWAIIAVIQITKSAIRLILLLIFNEGLSKTQEIVPLDRIHYMEIQRLYQKFSTYSRQLIEEIPNQDQVACKSSKSLVLKSSGRRVRSIDDSPPRSSRFIEEEEKIDENNPINAIQRRKLEFLINRYKEHKSAALTEKQLYGEIIHISRPMVHLALMGIFGTQSWISYFASIAMDTSSLYLIRPEPGSRSQDITSMVQTNTPFDITQLYQFNMNERFELGQRASSMMLYLLRSPFFDGYTKEKALEGLRSVGSSIPIVRNFVDTFVDYIPEWQKDYFRVWT